MLRLATAASLPFLEYPFRPSCVTVALSCHFSSDILCDNAEMHAPSGTMTLVTNLRKILVVINLPASGQVLSLHDDPSYLCRESLRIKFWHLFLLHVNGQVFMGTYPDFSFSR